MSYLATCVQPGEVLASHKSLFLLRLLLNAEKGSKNFSSFLTPLRVSRPICVIAFVVHFSGLGTKVNGIIRFSPSAVFCRRNMMSTSNKFKKQQPTIRFTSTENPSWPQGA